MSWINSCDGTPTAKDVLLTMGSSVQDWIWKPQVSPFDLKTSITTALVRGWWNLFLLSNNNIVLFLPSAAATAGETTSPAVSKLSSVTVIRDMGLRHKRWVKGRCSNKSFQETYSWEQLQQQQKNNQNVERLSAGLVCLSWMTEQDCGALFKLKPSLHPSIFNKFRWHGPNFPSALI